MTAAGDLFVRYTIDDEVSGPVEMTLSMSPDNARKVAGWAPSVARLYLGHEYGPAVQDALKGQLDRLAE